MSFKYVRILILLTVLGAIAGANWYQRHVLRSWQGPLAVHIYPINGDGGQVAADYIAQLSAEDFADLDAFFAREGRRYGTDLPRYLDVALKPPLAVQPPAPPPDGHPWDVMVWSLKLRYWVYKHTPDYRLGTTTVRLFVLYYEGEDDQALKHSLGLQRGLIGIVHAYALPRQTKQNNVVIAHELLHTLGATDKYGVHGLPLPPFGVADPYREPLYPQDRAEIMGGRIALSPTEAVMPASLADCVLGPLSAVEIGWFLKEA